LANLPDAERDVIDALRDGAADEVHVRMKDGKGQRDREREKA